MWAATRLAFPNGDFAKGPALPLVGHDDRDDRQVFRHISGGVDGAGESIGALDQECVHGVGDDIGLLGVQARPSEGPADLLVGVSGLGLQRRWRRGGFAT
jgi:hypothetical protein